MSLAGTIDSPRPIAIVGGGIAGLALARALHQRRMAVRVLERRPTAADGGLAINLPGNAIRALADLGLRDALGSIGHPVQRREYRTNRDQLLFQVDEMDLWGELNCPRAMKRSQLINLLSNGLESLIELSTEIRELTLHEDHVALSRADGTTLLSELIVGADGVHSLVRESLFSPTRAKSHSVLAEASWRFMAPNPGIDCWTVWVGSAGMILLLPVSETEVYGWAAITRGQGESSGAALISLAKDFPDRVRRTVAAALALPGTVHHSPLEEVRLQHWSHGRAVLIGDAAHACAPVWAQGGALALEDGIVLAECLAAGDSPAVALKAYERRRRPRVQHVQTMTDAMSKAALLPAFLRNLLLPRLGPKRYRQTYEPLKTPP